MEINKVGLIGLGCVGGTLRNWFIEHSDVKMKLYDPRLEFQDKLKGCKIVFIAVPVNNKSFKQDLTAIKESINRCDDDALIVIRSSVIPGTCDALSKEFNRKVCYMPEFLTERRAQKDFNSQDVWVGAPKGLTNKEREEIFEAFYYLFYYKKEENRKDVGILNNVDCEMGKYAHNCFGAMKVTYWNIINDLCERDGANFEAVKNLAFETGFINKEHTSVPGPDGRKGFGGSCFPVNIEAMIGYTKNHMSVAFFKDIFCMNRFFRGEK
jgi:UDPglucose 6-dehydrogenase